jgi:uncharacterized membrane protein
MWYVTGYLMIGAAIALASAAYEKNVRRPILSGILVALFWPAFVVQAAIVIARRQS